MRKHTFIVIIILAFVRAFHIDQSDFVDATVLPEDNAGNLQPFFTFTEILTFVFCASLIQIVAAWILNKGKMIYNLINLKREN